MCEELNAVFRERRILGLGCWRRRVVTAEPAWSPDDGLVGGRLERVGRGSEVAGGGGQDRLPLTDFAVDRPR